MKKLASLLTAIFLSYPLTAVAEDVEFNIINLSDSSIVGFYVSHSKANAWGGNLMPDGFLLPPGNQTDVTIHDGRTTCMYDIGAEFQDGEELEDYDIDICELESYTFE